MPGDFTRCAALPHPVPAFEELKHASSLDIEQAGFGYREMRQRCVAWLGGRVRKSGTDYTVVHTIGIVEAGPRGWVTPRVSILEDKHGLAGPNSIDESSATPSVHPCRYDSSVRRDGVGEDHVGV